MHGSLQLETSRNFCGPLMIQIHLPPLLQVTSDPPVGHSQASLSAIFMQALSIDRMQRRVSTTQANIPKAHAIKAVNEHEPATFELQAIHILSMNVTDRRIHVYHIQPWLAPYIHVLLPILDWRTCYTALGSEGGVLV